MTLYSDDLVRTTHWIGGLAIGAIGVHEAVTGPEMFSRAFTLARCGAALAFTAGNFQDYLRRRDTQVVVHLAKHPGAGLPQISKATGLNEERVGSSLQRLALDGLVIVETGDTTPFARSYRLSS
ncbi:MarR family transcriptional regulator [Streptomyces fildesensis]|uniref:MarR family transcriptional regulator n=1 Tax=Streptomyces fildesensis TaxID=375757 RepID=UPI0018E02096|nr:MarR family transcriptional regulator [Streptomyces fildesensis]